MLPRFALVVGECLLFAGLWMLWPPVALVSLGAQVCVWALAQEVGE